MLHSTLAIGLEWVRSRSHYNLSFQVNVWYSNNGQFDIASHSPGKYSGKCRKWDGVVVWQRIQSYLRFAHTCANDARSPGSHQMLAVELTPKQKKLSSGDGALCTHESLRVFSGTKQNVNVLAKWWMRTMAIVSKIDNLSFVRNFHCPNDDDDDGVGNGQPVCWVEASTLHAAVMLAWADNVEQALWLWI